MYNPKDIQFVGKHDYDKENTLAESGWNETFSVGVFKWLMKNNGKEMKKGKSIVRVTGPCEKAKEVFEMCESIVSDLDRGEFDGRKSVTIK